MPATRLTAAATLHDYKKRLMRVRLHIQQHLDEELRLEDLAALACFSPYHFHRVFKGMVGESLMGYIRRLRLERAASQLKRGRQSVTEVAFAAGYDTHEAFTRAFKSAFGLAPLQFRRRQSRTVALEAASGLHFNGQGKAAPFKTCTGRHKMKVQIVKVKPIRVGFIRHVGPYAGVGRAWEKLMMWFGKEGWLGGDTMFIGICYDDPDVTPADKIRYDACVSVDSQFEPADEIGVQVIPGGQYALTTHFGPYNTLGTTYIRLMGEWLPRSGRQLRSLPCFEIYLNDPGSTDPDDLLTDLYLPLA